MIFILKQFALSVDQTVNTLVWSSAEQKTGYADECLSARLYRLKDTSPNWKRAHDSLNWIARKLGISKSHCFDAWCDEFQRHQLPESYQTFLDQESLEPVADPK